ncbi:hypothetical protein BCR33DRAFT_738202 [Rhizoclosmatium globosum]|uniref:Uncharacterized protein n=1 Tax=Rhizoclosmatium globosum TaxID=329046 RepID=A0A1Y2CAG4_9FUNG|nr:hypothetical protein BCR33DRAFT_738202 [Rhizoclosmatium globosum]|eukprot:ORY44019.1 hypothetical protein BCR33DRAFT_738202 [Rhizoclosmatium globosum]
MRTPEDCIAALHRLPRTGLHVQREQAFRSYFLCLSQFTFESPVAVSPSHIEYFSLVASNESEHKYIRGIASFLSGYVKCVLSQRGEGDIARAVALFDDLSQSERSDPAWRFESRESETVEDCLGGPYGWRTLASEIVEHGFDGPEGSNSDNDSRRMIIPRF